MKKSRFSEEQIVAVLKEHESGTPTAELRRRTASHSRRCTAESRSTATWVGRTRNDSKAWKMRIGN
jgi:hypothetical protein